MKINTSLRINTRKSPARRVSGSQSDEKLQTVWSAVENHMVSLAGNIGLIKLKGVSVGGVRDD